MVVVEGVRKEWNPKMIQADVAELAFLKQAPFDRVQPILSSAFYIHDVHYRWRPGDVMGISDEASSLHPREP